MFRRSGYRFAVKNNAPLNESRACPDSKEAGHALSRGMPVYDWAKAFHLIAVIAWMAGMLYLPRLFVYHCEAELGSRQSETFKIMERRLLKAIINPAMIATWLLGLGLAWSGSWFWSHWLEAKIALVLA